jgi:hypothetical protein
MPAIDKTQVWNDPALICNAADVENNIIGMLESFQLLVPNWPKVFEPQHQTLPFWEITQVWLWPATTETNKSSNWISDKNMPLKSWPNDGNLALSPQQIKGWKDCASLL